jgi:transposase-like protein
LCEEIDDKVKAFLARPIEGDWPYLWIDATYVKRLTKITGGVMVV